MKNNSSIFLRQLPIACDFIMLSTLCTNIFYVFSTNKCDSILVLVTFNTILTILFRHWLTKALCIPWLKSPINRFLKRFADIIISILFLTIIFPFLYLFQVFNTKIRYGGAVLSPCKLKINQVTINTIKFNINPFQNRRCLKFSPIAFHIFIGRFSIWDLKTIQINEIQE